LVVSANVGYQGDIITDQGEVKTGQSTARLELDKNLIDTIKTEWESGKQYLRITKAWYNGELVYDIKNKLNGLKNAHGFVIIK